MKTGIFTLPDEKMGFFKAVEYAKRMGIDAIEPYPRAEFAVPDAQAAARLKDYAAENGVGVCCFSMSANIVGNDMESELEMLRLYADVAAAVGSPFLHHTLYPRLSFAACDISFKEALSRAVKGVREIFDYAEQKGVRCVYENQGLYFNGVNRIDDFLGEVNRNVGIVADLGNILFVGETPEAFAARFAPYICHVHLKDYLYKDSRWPSPGEGWYQSRDGGYLRGTIAGHGVVNFSRVFSILNAAGYDGYFSMEYDGMEEPFRAIELGLSNVRRFYRSACLDETNYRDVRPCLPE